MPRLQKGEKQTPINAAKSVDNLKVANRSLMKKYKGKMPWLKDNTEFAKQQQLALTLEELYEGACDYFQACTENPIKVNKLLSDGTQVTLEKPRIFTWSGLSVSLGVAETYFYNSRANRRGMYEKEEYLPVLEWIESIIRTQQLEYATVGEFNAGIVTRLLGLVDRQEVKQENKSSAVIEVVNEGTKEELTKLINGQ